MTTSHYIWPGQVHLGFGAAERAGAEARAENARHIFLIADPGVIAAGLLAPVVASLADAGLAYSVYDQVVPNPDSASIDAAAAA